MDKKQPRSSLFTNPTKKLPKKVAAIQSPSTSQSKNTFSSPFQATDSHTSYDALQESFYESLAPKEKDFTTIMQLVNSLNDEQRQLAMKYYQNNFYYQGIVNDLGSFLHHEYNRLENILFKNYFNVITEWFKNRWLGALMYIKTQVEEDTFSEFTQKLGEQFEEFNFDYKNFRFAGEQKSALTAATKEIIEGMIKHYLFFVHETDDVIVNSPSDSSSPKSFGSPTSP